MNKLTVEPVEDQHAALMAMERKLTENELLTAVYEHEWTIAPNGRAVIDVQWLLRLLNDPRALP